MTSETMKIVNAYREAGHIVTDDDCEKVFSICERKMDIYKIVDREAYMPMLFADEFKNFLLSRFINAVAHEYMHSALKKEA